MASPKMEKKMQKLFASERKELQKLAQKERKALEKIESDRLKELKKIDSKRKAKPGQSTSPLSALQPPERELNFMFSRLMVHLGVEGEEAAKMRRLSPESKWLFLCQHRHKIETTAESAKMELHDNPRHFIIKLQASPTAQDISDLAMTLSTADDGWFHSFRELNGPAQLLSVLLIEVERNNDRDKISELIRCIKMVMGQPEGLVQVMRTRGAVTKIAQCLAGADSKTKVSVYEILIAVCQAGADEGFELVLRSMQAFKYSQGEKQLFQQLVDSLHYDSSAKVRLMAMTLINVFCNTPDDVDQRLQTRNQFYRLNISGIIEEQRAAGTPSERLERQFSAFEKDAAADATEDSERFADASFDLSSVDALLEQLALRTKSNGPVRSTLVAILRNLIQFPTTEEGARLWMVVDKVVSQVSFQKGEILMDDEVNLDLDQVLLSIDDKIQLDVLQKKVEELKADSAKKLAEVKLDYEKQLQVAQAAATGGGGDGGRAARIAQNEMAQASTKSRELEAEVTRLNKEVDRQKSLLDELRKENMDLKSDLVNAKRAAATGTSGATPTSEAGGEYQPLPVIGQSAPAATGAAPPPPPPAPVAPAPPPPPPGAGGPPPPPPPGGKAGGGLFGNRKKYSQQPKPSVPMKLFNWQKMPAAKLPKSAWGEASALAASEREETISFDYPELEELFGRKQSRKTQAVNKTLKAASETAKTKVAEIIPARRSQNVGVILKSLPMKHTIQIRDAIEACNLSQLTADNLVKLAEAVPTPEEYDMVRSFVLSGGDKSLLGTTELFFLQIGDMKHMQPRISCLLFCLRAPHQCTEVREDLDKLLAGCRDMRSSYSFHKLLRVILELGNFVNGANNAKSNAPGFKVESLLQLESSKDVKGETNMLQWLFGFVEQRQSDILEWVRDIANVHTAASVSLQLAGQEFGEVRGQLAEAMKYAEMLEHGDDALPAADPWHSTVPEMLLHARTRVSELQKLYEQAQNEYAAVAALFGEDAKAMGSEDFFGTLRKFVEQWERARQMTVSRRQQLEREKERAIKKKARAELKDEMASKLKERNYKKNKAARPTASKSPAQPRKTPEATAAEAADLAAKGGVSWAHLLEGVTGGATFDSRRKEREIRRQATRGTQTLRKMAAQLSVQIKAKILIDKKTGNMWARDKKDNSRLVFIAEKDRHGAAHGDIARVEMHQRSDGKVSGFVVEVLND